MNRQARLFKMVKKLRKVPDEQWIILQVPLIKNQIIPLNAINTTVKYLFIHVIWESFLKLFLVFMYDADKLRQSPK